MSESEEVGVSSSTRVKGIGKRKISKRNKEEDVCFSCFDYGDLIVCDTKSCHKAYHRGCMDASLLNEKKSWKCDRHTCTTCKKPAIYMCYTCTYSVCKECIQEAEFIRVRRNQGFCRRCMETVMLIENNEHGNKEMDTGEYFKDYWDDLKHKLSFTVEELTQARNPFEVSNVIHKEEPADRLYEAYADQVSNSRSYSEQHEVISSTTKKARRQEGSSIEAIPGTDEGMPVSNGTEWASNELLEFVSHMKHGDTSVLSYFDVQALLVEYIARNNLFVPHQKSRILCDSRLQRLFGKTCMGQFEMFKLLRSHLMKKDNHADHIQGRLFNANRSEIEASSEPLRKVIPDKLGKIIKRGGHALPETNYEDCAAIVVQLETECFLDSGDIANGSGERTDGSSRNREIDDPQTNNWDKVRNQVPASETVQASLISTRDRLWCYQDPSGKIQGPFSILQLCKWSTTASFPANLRIWRTMEMQEDSILLIDALNTTFSRAQKVAAAYEDESVNGCESGSKGMDSSLPRTGNQQIDLTWGSDLKGAIGLASCNLEAGKSDGLSSAPTVGTAETLDLKVVGFGNPSYGRGSLNGNSTISSSPERTSQSTLVDAPHALLQVDVLDPQTNSQACLPTRSQLDGEEKAHDMSAAISVKTQGFTTQGIDSNLMSKQQRDINGNSDSGDANGLTSGSAEPAKSDGLSSRPSGWTAETLGLNAVRSGNSSHGWGSLNGNDTMSASLESTSPSILTDAPHAVLQVGVLGTRTKSGACLPPRSQLDGENKSHDASVIISVEAQGFSTPGMDNNLTRTDNQQIDLNLNSDLADANGLPMDSNEPVNGLSSKLSGLPAETVYLKAMWSGNSSHACESLNGNDTMSASPERTSLSTLEGASHAVLKEDVLDAQTKSATCLPTTSELDGGKKACDVSAIISVKTQGFTNQGMDGNVTRTCNQQIGLNGNSHLEDANGLADGNIEPAKSDGLSSEPSGWTAETLELKVVFSGNSSLDWGLLNGNDTMSACQERISKSTLADASHAVLQDVLDPQTTSETCLPTRSEFNGEVSRDMSAIISVEIQGFAKPPQPALDEALMDVGVNSETSPSELASSSGLIGNSSGNCDNLPKVNQGWDFSDKKSEQGPIIKSESLEWSNELPVNQKMCSGSIAAFVAEKPVLPFEKWRNDPCVVNSSATYVSTHTISEYNLDPDSKPSCGSANPPKLSCGGPAQETVTMDLVTASEGNEATNWGMSQLGNANNGLGTPAGNTVTRQNYQEIYENRYSSRQNRVTMLVSPYWVPYRNQLCRYHQRGYCNKGGFCGFRHPSL